MALTQIPLILMFKNKLLRGCWPFDWVLGRHACLGFEVMRTLGYGVRNFNNQKGRVDLLLSADDESFGNIDLNLIKACLDRKDLLDLIAQQKYLNCLPKHAPKFILLDSYSELTDKLFEHKENGWKFCCHNSDLRMTKSFPVFFNAHGLLDINLIYPLYSRLIEVLSIRYPRVPILFLNYPRALENRKVYIERSDVIKNSIEVISQRYKYLYPISVSEDVVDWKLDANGAPDMYPYHYNSETYAEFARLILDLTHFKKLIGGS